eukprot:7520378-Alexandrium_andersonii.AAC.1
MSRVGLGPVLAAGRPWSLLRGPRSPSPLSARRCRLPRLLPFPKAPGAPALFWRPRAVSGAPFAGSTTGT